MNSWALRLPGWALLAAALSGPAIAGHMTGKAHKHPCHQSMTGKQAMYSKGGHAYCKNMKQRQLGYGMPHYGRPYGPKAAGPRYGMGYKGPGYHRYGPMHRQHAAGKPAYGAPVADQQRGYQEQPSAAPDSEAKNIVETAVEAGKFSTLVKAVQAAGLAGTLNSDGPFTVFAPTDEAFAKLPEGTVEGLLNDSEALTQVLAYHVTGGKMMAADLLEQGTVETLNGASLGVDQLNVVKADIVTANGVIHIIDEVLLPPQS